MVSYALIEDDTPQAPKRIIKPPPPPEKRVGPVIIKTEYDYIVLSFVAASLLVLLLDLQK